jgi:hypothetical protein
MFLDEGDLYDRFHSVDENVVITFTTQMLRHEGTLNMSVHCANDYSSTSWSTEVTPTLRDLYIVEDAGRYALRNSEMLVFALVVLAALVILVGFGWRWLRR